MPYEPPDRGNPNQLTIDQHFHTAHIISMFYDAEGKVEVMDISTGEILRRHKRAKIFSTKRSWDQRAERGYMMPIEQAFHQEVDNIKRYSDRNHEAISRYCLLWLLRHRCHLNEQSDAVLKGITGSGLNKLQEENLEARGAVFVRDGGIVPSRFLAGTQIQVSMDRHWHTCSHFKWGILEAVDGEFLVADGYDGLPLIPISPKLAFYAGVEDQKIDRQTLVMINRETISRANDFYFARKISECPVT